METRELAEIGRLYVEFCAGTVRGSFLFGAKSCEALEHVGVGIQVSLNLGQKDQVVNIGIVDGIGLTCLLSESLAYC